MKRFLCIKFIIFLVLPVAFAKPPVQIKVIYGDDNRIDVEESLNEKYKKLADSTVSMISRNRLKEHNSEQYIFKGTNLQNRNICASERFSSQPIAPTCSGFLVGKNKIATAGHCIESQLDCDRYSWAFNYKVDFEDQTEVVLDKTDVYKCKKIISQSNTNDLDYAIIELEKEVVGHTPLKWRTEGAPEVGDPLVVIGNPSGLPTKIADGAVVREVLSSYMVANLDTFGGNSGSAVFNASTGMVEGILVRGDTDYIFDPKQNCMVANRLADNAGEGEEVTLINVVQGLPEPVKVVVPEEVDYFEDDYDDEYDDFWPEVEQQASTPRWLEKLLAWLRKVF